jgi:uncharacterized protein DUF1707
MTDSAAPLVPRRDTAPEHARLRASDADRERVAEVLRAAAVDGRLDFGELDERLTAVYAARTYGELEPLLSDLVVANPVAARPAPASTGPLELRTRSGHIKQGGHWVVPAHIIAESTSGSVKIDFTEADCRHTEIRVDASSRSGHVTLVVPRGWTVRVEATETSSGHIKTKVTDPPTPGSPTILLYGQVRSGSIVARYPYRTRRKR